MNTLCTYGANQSGEVSLNLADELAAQYGTAATSPSTYQIHADSAPNLYINGNPQPGNAAAQTLEQLTAQANQLIADAQAL